MTFGLRVLGDGTGSPSVTSDKQLLDVSRNSWQVSATRDLHARPVEFTISPAAGTVPLLSDVTIEVQLTDKLGKTHTNEVCLELAV